MSRSASMTGEVREREAPTRYWELIKAAGKLFQEKGYHAASVRDIADTLGITSGSIFYHFATKEDILVAVLENGMTEGLEIVQKKLEDAKGGRERLHALILGHLEALHSEHNYAHQVWLREWQQVSPDKRGPVEALRRSYRDGWLDVLEQVKSEGLISSDTALFRRLAVGALNWTVHWVRQPTQQELEDLADQFTKAFLNEPQAKGRMASGRNDSEGAERVGGAAQ